MLLIGPTSGPANINIRPVSTGVSRSRGTTHDISGNDDGDDDVAVSTNDINGITLMINWNVCLIFHFYRASAHC